MTNIPDTIRRPLLNLFTGSGFRKLSDARFLYVGVVDGITVGAIVASKRAPFDEFALNKTEFDRLCAGTASGKITEAFVVSVVYDGSDRTCVEVAAAADISSKLANTMPRSGRLGEFWTASSFIDGEEPF